MPSRAQKGTRAPRVSLALENVNRNRFEEVVVSLTAVD